jgi:glycosyltransferase involved in cell wall biosynthesis
VLTTSLGTTVDAPLRALYRALPAAAFGRGAPDPLDPTSAADLLTFLSTSPPDGGPARYLRAIHATRPDLADAFPSVPGPDDGAFLAWARSNAVAEGFPAVVVGPAVRRGAAPYRGAQTDHGPRTPSRAAHAVVPTRSPAALRRRRRGVNVVGFLRGELGIGESARLVIGALRAAGIPHRAVPVDQHLVSRQGTALREPATTTELFDTSVICVNADLTATIARSVGHVVDGSYRIGMWYWEVEDFPSSQHGGFSSVDEVWVATEFVRRAIAPHSPVPVHTVTPPLPQRGPEPSRTRADLGLPDGVPLFLFSFDFLSTAARKNPLGLLDAFRRAFAPAAGPVLVIKSINADRRPGEAERLRLAAADRPDVLLLEQYLDAADRDALMALCDCYVSLHRSEGLGLTMAEAMAWGKPVIATGYSGNLQFMTEQNSFLVPWTPTAIPDGAEPYPAGGVWAEPDLDAAAAAMRTVVEQPEVAAARGARAAEDIATLHSADVAGRRLAARLAAITPSRRIRSRVSSGLRRLARRVLSRID